MNLILSSFIVMAVSFPVGAAKAESKVEGATIFLPGKSKAATRFNLAQVG